MGRFVNTRSSREGEAARYGWAASPYRSGDLSPAPVTLGQQNAQAFARLGFDQG